MHRIANSLSASDNMSHFVDVAAGLSASPGGIVATTHPTSTVLTFQLIGACQSKAAEKAIPVAADKKPIAAVPKPAPQPALSVGRVLVASAKTAVVI